MYNIVIMGLYLKFGDSMSVQIILSLMHVHCPASQLYAPDEGRSIKMKSSNNISIFN